MGQKFYIDAIFGFLILVLAIVIAATINSFNEIDPIILVGISCFIALMIGLIFLAVIRILAKPIYDDVPPPTKSQIAKSAQISRHRFARAAIDAINSPILILDSEFHLLIANQTAKERFAITRFGARLEAFLRNPEILRVVEMAMKERVPKQFIWEHFYPSLKFDRVDIASFEYENELRIIIIFTDETDMRKAEQMRVDFLANAGHELRTPLASIRGFLETMQGVAKNDSAAQDRFLPIMSREAERMNRLINDIFSLSKIEFNEHVPPNSKVQLNEAINFGIISCEPQLKAAKRKIKFSPCKELSTVFADNDELQQIITNLIDNAIKYGAKESDIIVETFDTHSLDEAKKIAQNSWVGANSLSLLLPEDSHKQYFVARFVNYGKGIEARYLPRLSERFYRIDDESAHIRGTGLGLAIVKHILKRHSGGLFIETIVGDKTAFSFILPKI